MFELRYRKKHQKFNVLSKLWEKKGHHIPHPESGRTPSDGPVRNVNGRLWHDNKHLKNWTDDFLMKHNANMDFSSEQNLNYR